MRPARSPLGPGLSSQWGGLRATPLLAARAATPPPGPPCPCGGVVVHSPIGSFTPPGLWPVACPPPGFPPGPAGWAAPGRVAWSAALPLLRPPSWPCSAWLPPRAPGCGAPGPGAPRRRSAHASLGRHLPPGGAGLLCFFCCKLVVILGGRWGAETPIITARFSPVHDDRGEKIRTCKNWKICRLVSHHLTVRNLSNKIRVFALKRGRFLWAKKGPPEGVRPLLDNIETPKAIFGPSIVRRRPSFPFDFF